MDAGHWQNPWRKSHPIRVIDLLELRAGLPDLSGMEFDHNSPLNTKQALALNPEHRTVRWPPGLQHSYSNLVPGLSQLLIETLTQAPFAQVVQTRLFDKWGWDSAGFEPDPNLPGGYRADGVTEIPYWHMTFPAYGALNATIAELADLLSRLVAACPEKAVLAFSSQRFSSKTSQKPSVFDSRCPCARSLCPKYGQRLVNRQLSQLAIYHLRTTAGQLPAGRFGFDYAAGLYPRVGSGHVWFTHGGDADGYRSRLAFMHHTQRGYVVNINVDNPRLLRQIEGVLEAYLTRDLVPSLAATDPDAASIQKWVGSYYPSSVRFGLAGWQEGKLPQARITAVDGHLSFFRRGRTVTLFRTGPGQFRRQSDPVPTIQFFQWQGSTFMQGALGNYVLVDQCPQFMAGVPVCQE